MLELIEDFLLSIDNLRMLSILNFLIWLSSICKWSWFLDSRLRGNDKEEAARIPSFPRSRLCSNWQKFTYCCFCHSGLDPESSTFSRSYVTGCRIKSGMTSRNWTVFWIMTQSGRRESRKSILCLDPRLRGDMAGLPPARICVNLSQKSHPACFRHP